MAGEIKVLTFSEGVTVAAPSQSFLSASTFQTYVDDAAYVAAKGGAAADGDCYYNETLDLVRYYSNGAWSSFVDEDSIQDVVNKSLVDANNTFEDDGDGTKKMQFELSGITTGTTRTVTIPDADITMAGRDNIETFTNKTLTSPNINGGDINLGTASNASKAVISSNTTTNLEALTREAGSLYGDTTLGIPLYDDGSKLIRIEQTNDPHLMYNLGISTSLNANALTISLKQKDGSTDPTTTSPAIVSIKNGNGAYTLINVSSGMSITVPSGATLGHASSVAHYIYLYLINDGVSSELAVSRIQISERSLKSSTAISSSADLNSVLYSTNAKTNKYIRCIGRLTSTQTTAGTWATAMSDVTVGGYDIQGIEQLRFIGTNSSGQALSGPTGVIWSTVKDSHNINTGAAELYLPFDCEALVKLTLTHTTATHSTSGSFNSTIIRNGAESNASFTIGSGASVALNVTNGGDFQVSSGEYISVTAETSLGTGNLLASANLNRVSITAKPIL